MLDRLQKTIQEHANWRTVLVLLVALIALSTMLNVSNIPIGLNSLTELSGGRMILDMRTDYTPEWCIETVRAHPLGQVLDSLARLSERLDALGAEA